MVTAPRMSPGGNAQMGTIPNAASKPLEGSIALITGASRGIGLAIARKLAQLGARLSLCARDAARLDAAGADLRRDGFETLTMVADVTHADEIQNLVDRTHRELGPIDILVNNAGIGRFGPAHQMTEADWDAVFDTNLKSVFLVTRAVVPEMIERKRGHIVNISSLAGKNAFAGGGIYCASKWGLMGLTGLHGRRSPRPQHSRMRGLPRQRSHRFFPAHRPRHVETITTRRRSPRRSDNSDASPTKFHQRNPPETDPKAVSSAGVPAGIRRPPRSLMAQKNAGLSRRK